MTLSAGTKLGPYEILAPLGMGEVYLVRDTKLKHDAAIKLLQVRLARNPDARGRFS